MNHNNHQINPSMQVDVNWTLSELESIVYDFINFNPKQHNQEYIETAFKPMDVQKEDLMRIQKIDKKKAEEQPLP
jgi:GTPase Era involved in 16S rRNA processing